MIKHLLLGSLVSSFLASMAGPGIAASAEETFVFIIFGVEANQKAAMKTGQTADVRITGQDPLTYEIAFGTEKAVMAVKREEPCIFNVSANLGEVGNANIRFDMSKLVGLKNATFIKKENVRLIFTNECAIQVKENQRCVAGNFQPGAMIGQDFDAERVERAIAYFQKEFCAGSPF